MSEDVGFAYLDKDGLYRCKGCSGFQFAVFDQGKGIKAMCLDCVQRASLKVRVVKKMKNPSDIDVMF